MRKSTLALAAVAALSITAAADAAVVTTDYSFTTGIGPGTFSLGFDTNTSVYSLVALSFDVGSTHFDTTNSGVLDFGALGLALGGNPSGVQGVFLDGFADDFYFPFSPDTVNLQTTLTYSIGTQPFSTSTLVITQVTIRPEAPGVPEPASWVMMLMGFGAVGFAVRRRTQTELTFRRAA
jgi:hypothetical protein